MKFVINSDFDGATAIKFVKKTCQNLSLVTIEKLFRQKKILGPKGKLEKKDLLRKGDELKILAEDLGIKTYQITKVDEQIIHKYFIPLYEDDFLLVINKKAGIAVHGSEQKQINLQSIVEAKLGQKVFLLHRLDQTTSGAILLAKDGAVARQMLADLREQKWQKQYLALVFGHLPEQAGQIREKIAEQEAKTDYQVLAEFFGFSLVNLWPQTGRKHQLRIHLAHFGCPIVMDSKYGEKNKNDDFRKKYGLQRQFLHATEIKFFHPGKNKTLSIKSPLPKDLESVLDKIQK